VSKLAQTRQVRRLFHLNHEDGGGQVSAVNQFVDVSYFAQTPGGRRRKLRGIIYVVFFREVSRWR
jgi:hypothetical protein